MHFPIAGNQRAACHRLCLDVSAATTATKQPLADDLQAEKRRFTRRYRQLRGRALLFMMRALKPTGPHSSNRTIMLRGIRTASTNWLGRAVMGAVMVLLAASFAVWGINDIFHGFGRSTLAKIGGTEIQIEQFRQLYNERLQQIGRQFGRAL